MIVKRTPWVETSRQNKIALLGEAPDKWEMAKGRPFVGNAGKMLRQCLKGAGLFRDQVDIINVWKRPVIKLKSGRWLDKETKVCLWSGGKFTKIGREWAQDTLDELATWGFNVLVPMGNPALELVYGETSITKWRGSILTASAEEIRGRKLVPSIHPAFILYGNPHWEHVLASDLGRAKEESSGSSILLPERNYLLRPSLLDATWFLNKCAEKQNVAFDVETFNHQISCISFAYDSKNVMAVPLIDEHGRHYFSETEEASFWVAVAKLMGNEGVRKYNQNVWFDIFVLLWCNKIWTRGPIDDTMILFNILFPGFPKDLGFICSLMTREPYYKDEGKSWKKPWGSNWETFIKYNAKDSVVIPEAWGNCIEYLMQLPTELRTKLWQTYINTMSLGWPAMFMQYVGVLIDRDELERTKVQVVKDLAELQEGLDAMVGRHLNVASPKQCTEYLYEECGYPHYIGPGGALTAGEKALSGLARVHGVKEAGIMLKIRALQGFQKFLKRPVDADNRQRCSVNLRGTWTGRLSTSELLITGTGGNQQNQHPKYLRFMVAD